MATQQEAMDALAQINEATNEQAERMTELATTTQEISDDIDRLLADATNVPAEVVDGMKAAATNAKAVADSLTQHAAFAKAIASKSPAQPVPVDVPPPVETNP